MLKAELLPGVGVDNDQIIELRARPPRISPWLSSLGAGILVLLTTWGIAWFMYHQAQLAMMSLANISPTVLQTQLQSMREAVWLAGLIGLLLALVTGLSLWWVHKRDTALRQLGRSFAKRKAFGKPDGSWWKRARA